MVNDNEPVRVDARRLTQVENALDTVLFMEQAMMECTKRVFNVVIALQTERVGTDPHRILMSTLRMAVHEFSQVQVTNANIRAMLNCGQMVTPDTFKTLMGDAS